MYHAGLDVACCVRASNLVQELGMVSNIFTDKTGTLTCNEMRLVKYVLRGKIYDVPEPPPSPSPSPSSAQPVDVNTDTSPATVEAEVPTALGEVSSPSRGKSVNIPASGGRPKRGKKVDRARLERSGSDSSSSSDSEGGGGGGREEREANGDASSERPLVEKDLFQFLRCR
jgi:magnesium-transporting ATPase (P-type)